MACHVTTIHQAKGFTVEEPDSRTDKPGATVSVSISSVCLECQPAALSVNANGFKR